MIRGRFIAGAVCPNCAQMDRLLVESVAGTQQRRCVSCGHIDQLTGSSHLPKARFERVSGIDSGIQEITTVRILDPGGRKRR